MPRSHDGTCPAPDSHRTTRAVIGHVLRTHTHPATHGDTPQRLAPPNIRMGGLELGSLHFNTAGTIRVFRILRVEMSLVELTDYIR